MQTTPGRPLLLVGAGQRAYYAHSFLQMAATWPLVLVDRTTPAWVRPYLAGEIATGLSAADDVVSAVRKFTATRPAAGVVTYLTGHAALTANVARMLGLPGNRPDAVASAQGATWIPRAPHKAGVSTASASMVAYEDSVMAAARTVDSPTAVTTAGGEGPLRANGVNGARAVSQGVREGASAAPFAAAVAVEEFGLEGADVGVEAVLVSSEDIRFVAVTRNIVDTAVAASPLGYSVCAHDSLLHDETLQNSVAKAITERGLATGVVHADVRLDTRGPRVLRISPCLAEGLIPLLVVRATGISLARVAASLAAGFLPDLSPTLKRAAAVRFLYPSASGQLAGRAAPEAYMGRPWLDRFSWTHQTEEEVLGPPFSGFEDRLAHWVVTGSDSLECASRLHLVGEQISAQIVPSADRSVDVS
ncbi:hypothetical protein N8I84_41475 (plasmid) [Streptomyces cynarae]|uniref:ATP-grasp domain-containing protein n=1 Tax=Streptomyces cynarae TaxID=2981134 RepID=A0ABY6EDV0_9ACTN|nr:hypothetical protein [Streptomyces cynarae]UXY24920.1 hypothetical protein N8I84_41475 [Streptomyces cynarae]